MMLAINDHDRTFTLVDTPFSDSLNVKESQEKLRGYERILKDNFHQADNQSPYAHLLQREITKIIIQDAQLTVHRARKCFRRSVRKIEYLQSLEESIQEIASRLIGLWSLPTEMILRIISFFSIADLKSFERTSKVGKSLTRPALMQHALTLGYHGPSSIQYANHYLKELYLAGRYICSHNHKKKADKSFTLKYDLTAYPLLSKEFISTQKMDLKNEVETSLVMLQKWTMNDIVKALSNSSWFKTPYLETFFNYLRQHLSSDAKAIQPLAAEMTEHLKIAFLRLIADRQYEGVELFLKWGVEVNFICYNVDEYIPLHIAIETNDMGILELLLPCINNINQVNYMDCSALHIAAYNGFSDMAARLLTQGANINLTNGAGETPLMLSVKHKRMDCLKILISYGANKTIPDRKRRTPLDWAKKMKNKEMIAILN